ncbi:E3 ubiquitin-protein ligase MARCHF6-like isoform 2-T4 [Aulostomus maculatus]
MPFYSPDMPSRSPILDIFAGLVTSTGTAIRYLFHYTLVAFAWLGVVALTACRIYKCLFTDSVSSLLTLPLDMLSMFLLIMLQSLSKLLWMLLQASSTLGTLPLTG